VLRAEAWALADRLLVLLDGRVAAHGTPAQVLEQPPSMEVARFLGFTGQLPDGNGGVRCLRPAHVAFDPDGDTVGTVTRRIPEEDAVLCEVAVEGYRVEVRAGYPGPEQDQEVRLRVQGGVTFRTGGAG
jgi:ABC-type sulfate/molybdate transport systems ATPase subunit